MQKTEMSTLSGVMETLRERGYTHDFNMSDDGLLHDPGTDKKYSTEQVCIDKVYRFEGDSDPGDMSILYAIRATDGTLGQYIDGYGASGSNEGPGFADFIKNVCIKREDDEHLTDNFTDKVKNFISGLFHSK